MFPLFPPENAKTFSDSLNIGYDHENIRNNLVENTSSILQISKQLTDEHA